MKKKNKKATPRKIKEFRYHCVEIVIVQRKKKIWHPTYVFLLIGNTYKYVVVTHSKSVKGKMLIKLRKNPNPKDKRESYRSVEIKTDTRDKFSRPRENWEMDPLDDQDIRKQNKNDDSAD